MTVHKSNLAGPPSCHGAGSAVDSRAPPEEDPDWVMDDGGDGASPRRPTLAEARAAMFARQEAAATHHVSFFPIVCWRSKAMPASLQPSETGPGSVLS